MGAETAAGDVPPQAGPLAGDPNGGGSLQCVKGLNYARLLLSPTLMRLFLSLIVWQDVVGVLNVATDTTNRPVQLRGHLPLYPCTSPHVCPAECCRDSDHNHQHCHPVMLRVLHAAEPLGLDPALCLQARARTAQARPAAAKPHLQLGLHGIR
jgi:hypothetical protein